MTMTLTVQADDKAMAIADQIAEIFGETKYSISFFSAGQKINLNDKVALADEFQLSNSSVGFNSVIASFACHHFW